MIILGIDPGTTRIGIGIIKNHNKSLSCVHYELLPMSSRDKSDSIREVIQGLNKLIQKYKPDLAAIEKIFLFKNQKTVISVSEMRGVILTALAMNQIPVREFTPLQVKQAVSSYGRAGKDQIEQMVRIILGLKDKIKPDDVADGLAIAICCANNIVYQAN